MARSHSFVQSATLQTFTVATNEYRGQNAGERTEYHAIAAWDRLGEKPRP